MGTLGSGVFGDASVGREGRGREGEEGGMELG